MRVQFEDKDLGRLYSDASYRHPRFGADITKQFRKKVQFLKDATDERDIRSMRSLNLEKLSGDRAGQHSIRLNDQWRLILRFDSDSEGQIIVVISITDYH